MWYGSETEQRAGLLTSFLLWVWLYYDNKTVEEGPLHLAFLEVSTAAMKSFTYSVESIHTVYYYLLPAENPETLVFHVSLQWRWYGQWNLLLELRLDGRERGNEWNTFCSVGSESRNTSITRS